MKISAARNGNPLALGPVTLQGPDSLPYRALGGLDKLAPGSVAEHTFAFGRAVSAFGLGYRCFSDIAIDKVTYVLANGGIVNIKAGGEMLAGAKTFVGMSIRPTLELLP